MQLAKIIIGITTKSLNKPFTYIIPTDLIQEVEIGSVVLVPFGRGNTIQKGYVIEIGTLTQKPEFEMKEIKEVINTMSVEVELIKLAYWIHNRYHCPLISSLNLMIPSEVTTTLKSRKTLIVNENHQKMISEYLAENDNSKKLMKRHEILTFISSIIQNTPQRDEHVFVEKDILTQFNTSSSILKSLAEKGLFSRVDMTYKRKINLLEGNLPSEKLSLTKEQQKAVDAVYAVMKTDGPKKDYTKQDETKENNVFLLHGVTGSGKTEVYMQLIESVINAGKEAIVLIPEIALTPQTIRRFVSRFGDVVGVMHSRLNPGERYEQWLRAKNGEIKIMVGARSAIFTPFTNLGMIVIDEEHEHTYKSEQSPKYHAREIAIWRSIFHGCIVILGSATPLIESYYKATSNQYKLLTLDNKAIECSKRSVFNIDMRHELEQGNLSILSGPLYQSIVEALERKEQIILFLNRRGYANFVSCRQCGFVYRCDACDVSMTYHSSNQRMICHYCGASTRLEKTCPSCHSKYIKAFGTGTQRIEADIIKQFPGARIDRMDQDTTGTKHGHEEILNRFKNKEVDILIGTQMLAKGHDFHNVTVVGVLAADLSLHIEDFRSAERTFQLVTQVIGRTGRGLLPGKAFIQSYSPEHYAIKFALEEDYFGFYEEEIRFRKTMVYPPYCHLLQVICLSKEEHRGMDFFKENIPLIEKLFLHIEPNQRPILLGPTKTTIGKVKNVYRHRLLIKGSSYKQLTNVIKELYNSIDKMTNKEDVYLQMDINPMSLL